VRNSVQYFINAFETEEADPYVSEDEEKVSVYGKIRKGCGCQNCCMSKLDNLGMYHHVLTVREMSRSEKDLYIMGTLKTIGVDKNKSRYGERKRTRYEYIYDSVVICRSAFEIMYDIGPTAMKGIIKHMNENGPVPRVHGNTGKSPKHALQFLDVENAVRYVRNVGNEEGIPQPAAPRGRDSEPPIYLPACLTKVKLHERYESSCKEADFRALGLTAFKNVWASCCSHIKVSSPRDDVCHICEKARKRITDARTEQDTLNAVNAFQQHLTNAATERELYQTCVKSSAEELHGVQRGEGAIPPMSTHYRKIHYTFDFAQQVSIPHHARQMGPLYFLCARKIQVFGVRLDGIPRQFNYLVDEDETLGKDGKEAHGPDSVISMVDHSLGKYGYGEQDCVVHADNCCGKLLCF
jgi:hypothetical protein